MSLSEIATAALTLALTLGTAVFELRGRRVPELLGGAGLALALASHLVLGGRLDVLSGVLGVLVGAFPWLALRAEHALGRGQLFLAAGFGAALRVPGALVLTGLGLVLWAGVALAPRFGLARRDVGRGLSEARPGTILGAIATIQALSPLWLD